MADLDTFAAALGVADLAPPPLTEAERRYVAGLVRGLKASAGRRESTGGATRPLRSGWSG